MSQRGYVFLPSENLVDAVQSQLCQMVEIVAEKLQLALGHFCLLIWLIIDIGF
jgi:hypothetical protein